MKKPIQIYYIILMLVLLAAPVLFFKAFGSRFDETNNENRDLSARPVLSAGTIGTFPSDYDSWFSDNLPFKNQFVRLYALFNYRVLGTSTNDNVIVGKDGWLFYSGSQANNEDPVADYLGTNLFTDEELAKIRDNMIAARDELKERNCDFYIFIAPNKERVYSEYMPDAYGKPSENGRMQQVVQYLKENTDIPVICSYEDLLAYKEEHTDQQIYYKYDTHWNELGAYVGAQTLVKRLGFSLPDTDELDITNIGGGSFDLARLIGLGDVLTTDTAYDIEGYTDYMIIPSTNDTFTEFRYYNHNNDGSHKKLLIVGDSFSSFLSPYVACHYNNAYTCFYYNYSRDVLDTEKPNDFVYETVERYIGNMLTFSLDGGIGSDAEPQ